MTGAGVALDAASRGLRVALIDRATSRRAPVRNPPRWSTADFATSSKRSSDSSTRTCANASDCSTNAPFLVRPLPFLVPLFGRTAWRPRRWCKGYSTALRIYDLSGGWRIGHRYRKVTPRRGARAPADAHAPIDSWPGSSTSTLAATTRASRSRSPRPRPSTSTRRRELRARRATSPGRDGPRRTASIVTTSSGTRRSRSRRGRSSTPPACGPTTSSRWPSTRRRTGSRPAKGVHLSVPRDRLPADVAAVFNVAGRSSKHLRRPLRRRALHLRRHDRHRLRGLARRSHAARPRTSRTCSTRSTPRRRRISRPSDVTGVWAGLRPLLAPVKRQGGEGTNRRPLAAPPRHRSGDGVVHITGGKWTTYRQMAQDAVDALKPYVGDLHGVAHEDAAPLRRG